MSPDMSGESRKERDVAQVAFVDHLKKNGKATPLLVARFVARQVSAETAKVVPGNMYYAPPDNGDYTMDDHFERLRYLELNPPEDEYRLLGKVLSTALPGLEQLINDERHTTLMGKMAYNAYGVCFDGGRYDKASSMDRIQWSVALILCNSPNPRSVLRMLKKPEHLMAPLSKSVVHCTSCRHM